MVHSATCHVRQQGMRPFFAGFFFPSIGQEDRHAIMYLQYLPQRGGRKNVFFGKGKFSSTGRKVLLLLAVRFHLSAPVESDRKAGLLLFLCDQVEAAPRCLHNRAVKALTS